MLPSPPPTPPPTIQSLQPKPSLPGSPRPAPQPHVVMETTQRWYASVSTIYELKVAHRGNAWACVFVGVCGCGWVWVCACLLACVTSSLGYIIQVEPKLVFTSFLFITKKYICMIIPAHFLFVRFQNGSL